MGARERATRLVVVHIPPVRAGEWVRGRRRARATRCIDPASRLARRALLARRPHAHRSLDVRASTRARAGLSVGCGRRRRGRGGARGGWAASQRERGVRKTRSSPQATEACAGEGRCGPRSAREKLGRRHRAIRRGRLGRWTRTPCLGIRASRCELCSSCGASAMGQRMGCTGARRGAPGISITHLRPGRPRER